MTFILKTTITAVVLLAGFSALLASEKGEKIPSMDVSATHQAVRSKLIGQGYDVRKIETEDGYLEVYAIKDGRKYELYLKPETLEIQKIKQGG
ncbi:MAG: hypothetical protein DHS20C08_15720 [Rhodomicrobium sp.]|nr:MAG: hypothetical protein DHS20C08_15720 [Rhodomicrobium sp.]